jgi:hypothetical protein
MRNLFQSLNNIISRRVMFEPTCVTIYTVLHIKYPDKSEFAPKLTYYILLYIFTV